MQVKLHVEGDENLVIPLHGYPVTNGASFPSRVDFGRCALGDTLVRRIPLECKVPLDFEFEIRTVKGSESFTVEPTSGRLSANSATEITVSYRPTRMVTDTCEIELR